MNKYYVSRDGMFGKFFYAKNDAIAMAYAEGYAEGKEWNEVAKHWRLYNVTRHRGVMSVNAA